MDGQSYLLLIRDEGGPPEAQVGTTYISLPLLYAGSECFIKCGRLSENYILLLFTETLKL